MTRRRMTTICLTVGLALVALPAAAAPTESTTSDRPEHDGSLASPIVIEVVDDDRLTRSGRVRDVSYWIKTDGGMRRIGGATIRYHDIDRDGEPDDDEVVSISPN